MEKPDTVAVTITRRDEIQADKVDVHVTIKGNSLVTGSAALKKAKEVSQLVSALAELGIQEQEIALKSVHAESSSGILGKSTSASYQLQIKCKDLDLLADILGLVTSQKNSKLDFLGWGYPDDKKLKAEWLDGCLVESKQKAKTIASSLGVELLGVHSFSEKWLDSEMGDLRRLSELGAANVGVAKLMRSERIDLGFALSHSKWLEVQIEVVFRVSDFKPGQ